MRKMLFIFNPRSSKEQIRRQLTEVLDVFTRTGYRLRIHVTQKQKDAMDAVARLDKKVDVVVCNGEDGTLSETIPGMMRPKKTPLLGCTLVGSTNDFITSLGIPKRMPLAAWDIMEGTPFAIDTRTFCEDRNSMYIAAFGAFTEVSYLTSQDRKNLLGHQAYMLEGVKSLAGLKPYHMRVEWDGQVLEEDFAFGMMTDAISAGGFKGLVNQFTAFNDGLSEVLLVRIPRTPVDLSNTISYMFLGEEPDEYVHEFKTSSIRLTSKQRVDWMLDDKYSDSRTEMIIGDIRGSIQILLGGHPEEESGRRQIE